MALSDEIMLANPVGYWPLSTNFTNRAGITATNVTAAPAYSQRNITSEGPASLFDTTDRATIPNESTIMYAGRENTNFTVETFVRTVDTPNATRRIFGRALPEGLYVTTAGFEFVAVTTAATYTLRYDVPTWAKTYHVAVTYSNKTFTLFVNGAQVASKTIEGTFTNTVGDIVIGGSVTTSTTSFFLSDLAYYRRALPNYVIAAHYAAGINLPTQSSLIEQDGGISYNFLDESADVFLKFNDHFEQFGLDTNLTLSGDNFVLTDPALAGTRVTETMVLADGGVIDGSRVSWVGSGVTVERSLDAGATWAACTNNATVPGLGEGVNVDTLFVTFRITLAASSTAFYNSLQLVVYTNKNARGSMNGMMTSGTEPYTLAAFEKTPLANEPETGVQIRTSGRLALPAAPAGSSWKALEMWVRPTGPLSNGHFYDYRTSLSDTVGYAWISATPAYNDAGNVRVYVNGVLKAPVLADFVIGQWTHLLFVFTNPTTNSIYLGNNVAHTAGLNLDIAAVGLYLVEPPASTPAEHYTLGLQRGTVRTTEQLGLIEGVESGNRLGPRAYKFAWNVETAQ